MSKYQAADQAVKAYDAFIFSSVGFAFDADRADLLAINAAEACAQAARDRSVNQFTRDHYRALRDQFAAIPA